MSSELVFHIRKADPFLRTTLTYVERSFNHAAYLPVVHRVSGGARMVYGAAEAIVAVALAILIQGFGGLQGNIELQKEGWKILDFAVHGLANIVRGFIESHPWIHLFFPLHDYFVQAENSRDGLPCVGLSYDRPIFGR